MIKAGDLLSILNAPYNKYRVGVIATSSDKNSYIIFGLVDAASASIGASVTTSYNTLLGRIVYYDSRNLIAIVRIEELGSENKIIQGFGAITGVANVSQNDIGTRPFCISGETGFDQVIIKDVNANAVIKTIDGPRNFSGLIATEVVQKTEGGHLI